MRRDGFISSGRPKTGDVNPTGGQCHNQPHCGINSVVKCVTRISTDLIKTRLYNAGISTQEVTRFLGEIEVPEGIAHCNSLACGETAREKLEPADKKLQAEVKKFISTSRRRMEMPTRTAYATGG